MTRSETDTPGYFYARGGQGIGDLLLRDFSALSAGGTEGRHPAGELDHTEALRGNGRVEGHSLQVIRNDRSFFSSFN